MWHDCVGRPPSVCSSRRRYLECERDSLLPLKVPVKLEDGMQRMFVLLTSLVFAVATLNATTIIPPTFEQLVARADLVFETEVIDVQSQWTTVGGARTITTHVSFR